MFCGQCGIEIAEQDSFCTSCGRKATTKKVIPKKEQQPEPLVFDTCSVNNWHDIYQSIGKYSKENQEKKRLAKVDKEKLEKKRIAKMKRQEKKRLVQEEKEKKRLEKKEKEEKLEKSIISPVLPQQSTFSFSSNRLLPLTVVGFVLGLVTLILIGSAMAATSVNGTSDPYGCTICDPFNPAYDGPPPIYMDDLGFGYDDDYYYDDYYYDDGYYP